MPIEAIRSCGFRKVGGLYLIGSGIITTCNRLPYNLPDLCPACGCGIKQHRGFQWINPQVFFGNHKENCDELDMMCQPPNSSEGLMWVGNRYYSSKSFIEEASRLGVSKRIAHIPKGLILGKTIVYLAHPSGGVHEVEEQTALGVIKKTEPCPAIFYVFRPQRIEKLIWKSEATSDTILELEKQGITPVIVPDEDKAHDPSIPMSKDIKDSKKPKYKNLEETFKEAS